MSDNPTEKSTSMYPECKRVFTLKEAVTDLARVLDGPVRVLGEVALIERVIEAAVRKHGVVLVLRSIMERIDERFRLDQDVCLICDGELPNPRNPRHPYHCGKCRGSYWPDDIQIDASSFG